MRSVFEGSESFIKERPEEICSREKILEYEVICYFFWFIILLMKACVSGVSLYVVCLPLELQISVYYAIK